MNFSKLLGTPFLENTSGGCFSIYILRCFLFTQKQLMSRSFYLWSCVCPLIVAFKIGTWAVVFTKTFNTKFPSFLFNEQTLRVCPSLNLVLKLASKDYGHCHFHFSKTGFSKNKVKPRKSILLLQVTDWRDIDWIFESVV